MLICTNIIISVVVVVVAVVIAFLSGKVSGTATSCLLFRHDKENIERAVHVPVPETTTGVTPEEPPSYDHWVTGPHPWSWVRDMTKRRADSGIGRFRLAVVTFAACLVFVHEKNLISCTPKHFSESHALRRRMVSHVTTLIPVSNADQDIFRWAKNFLELVDQAGF